LKNNVTLSEEDISINLCSKNRNQKRSEFSSLISQIGGENTFKCDDSYSHSISPSVHTKEYIKRKEIKKEFKTKDTFTQFFLSKYLNEKPSTACVIVRNSLLDSTLDLHMSHEIYQEWYGDGEIASINWTEIAMHYLQNIDVIVSNNWNFFNDNEINEHIDSMPTLRYTPFTALQSTVYAPTSHYADILITCGTRKNRKSICNVLNLHIINHILVSNKFVQAHNEHTHKLKLAEDTGGQSFDDVDNSIWKDQGYTRPKVLILTATRGTCHTYVKHLIDLLGKSVKSQSVKRFDTEFGVLKLNDDINNRRTDILNKKGTSWLDLFGDNVNPDDDFKIGIQLHIQKDPDEKKNPISLSLYSEFYHSDIIVASPLGLITNVIGKNKDIDFLSSIEICLIDHSNVILMQNWDHVNTLLECLNQQPINNNDTDFSRVRSYFLSGRAKQRRQLIMYSQFDDPAILSTFKRFSKSNNGKMTLQRNTPVNKASICQVLVKVGHVFQKTPCTSLSSQGVEKWSYFRDKVLRRLLQQKYVLIFIPSYFDFITVRKYLFKTNASFVSVTEYSRISEVSRGRARFLQGHKHMLLYTGRAHFFLRHHIKGIRHLIFYGPPEYAEFYPQLVNMLSDTSRDVDYESPLSCMSFFNKYEAQSLSRIVGTIHSLSMVSSEKTTFVFNS